MEWKRKCELNLTSSHPIIVGVAPSGHCAPIDQRQQFPTDYRLFSYRAQFIGTGTALQLTSLTGKTQSIDPIKMSIRSESTAH